MGIPTKATKHDNANTPMWKAVGTYAQNAKEAMEEWANWIEKIPNPPRTRKLEIQHIPETQRGQIRT